MKVIDVSIIFVNYKTPQMTADAINSVFDKTEGFNLEVLVVENASNDGSAEFLRKEFGDRIILIESPDNRGFGAGNNQAIRKARGKYIFLLNTDTLLINNAIKIMFDFMENNPTAGVCGANMYDKDLKPANSFGFFYKNTGVIKRILGMLRNRIFYKRKRRDFNYSNRTRKVDWIIGADMFVRKAALDEAGLFDEDFFMYSEEVELTHRISKKGWGVFSVPTAKIMHLEGGSQKSPETIARRAKMLEYGILLLYEKIFGKRAVKRRYKNEIFIMHLLNILKLGRSNHYKQHLQPLKEAYKEWNEKRNHI